MVTIRDVAGVARVSIKTVSRVINDHPDVADETRCKVQRVVDELGYRPSTLARNLVRGEVNTVGVVIPLSARYIFSHPFFSEVLKGIAEVLSDRNLDLLLYLSQDDVPYVELYHRRRVDGLILMSVSVDDPYLDGLIEGEVPCVFTCRVTEDESSAHWVDADFAGGVEQAADHLLDLGHQQIALLAGPANLISVHLRVKGYRQALARRGIPVLDDRVVYADFSFEAGRDLAAALMRREPPPTAFICGDDMLALGAMEGLHEEGYQVPDDVSIVGFDDVALARFALPPLTTVRQHAYDKGATAARLLVALRSGSVEDGPLQVLMGTELLVRGSTAQKK